MSAFVLSQLLIGVAFLIDLASFQFRERCYVLMCLAAAACLIGVHFWLLDAYTAAFLGFLAALRFITALFSRSPLLLMLFLGVVLVNAVLTWVGVMSLLATVGSLISTTAAFLHSDRGFRIMMMIASLFWIAHNAVAQSPAAIALESFFLLSNLVGYYRHHLRGLRE